jgi:hypothetical protein
VVEDAQRRGKRLREDIESLKIYNLPPSKDEEYLVLQLPE